MQGEQHRPTKAGAEGWLARGWALLDEGDAKQALDCADRAIKSDERGVLSAHTLRGDSLLRLGHWADAFAAFAEAARYDPHQFDASNWSARGDQFLQSEEPELALKAYQRAIDQDERNPEGWHGKGVVLERRGDLEGALAAFERASEADQRFIAGFLDAGRLCLERADLDRALRFFEHAREAQPEDPRPWKAIGSVHWEGQRYNEARAAYERAATLDPADADTWCRLGHNFVRLEQYPDAMRSYERAIEADPDYGWGHNYLANLLSWNRRFDDATHANNRAIELDPNNGDFWVTKLFILNSADSIEDETFEAAIDRALMAIGPDVILQTYVMHFLADNNRMDRARELVDNIELATIENATAEERLNFAELLIKIGKNDHAIALLGNIDSTRLPKPMSETWSFLCLLSERLAGTPPLSEKLLIRFLREFQQDENRIVGWNYKGVRHLLARSELTVLEKLALATLIDVQERNVRCSDLSFFAEIWKNSGDADATCISHLAN